MVFVIDSNVFLVPRLKIIFLTEFRVLLLKLQNKSGLFLNNGIKYVGISPW